MTYTIYKIVNKILNKTYVGCTNREIVLRWLEHGYPSNKKELGQDIRNLGIQNFEFTILEKNILPENIKVKERYWIIKNNSLKPNGYNTILGYFNVYS